MILVKKGFYNSKEVNLSHKSENTKLISIIILCIGILKQESSRSTGDGVQCLISYDGLSNFKW